MSKVGRKSNVIILLIAVIFLSLLIWGITAKNNENSEVLIGEPIPHFELLSLYDPQNYNPQQANASQRYINQNDLHQLPMQLINVWASWCSTCRLEHAYLLTLKQQGIPIIGINYRDQRQAAINVLLQEGDPYQQVIFDPKGSLALDLGVMGTPESYLVNQQGVIVQRYRGQLSAEVWQRYFAPHFVSLPSTPSLSAQQ